MFALRERYLPPPPGFPSPTEWGDRATVQQRLGGAARDIIFANGVMISPALSPQQYRAMQERTAGSMIKLVDTLSVNDPAKLVAFRTEYDVLVAEYFQENAIHQTYLMTWRHKTDRPEAA